MPFVEYDDKGVGNRFDFFKFPGAQGGQISRACVISKQAVFEKIHYDFGYVKCTKDSPLGCAWCKQGKDADDRFASFIILYNTNEQGMPYEPLTFRIEPWAYGADKFGSLRVIKNNFGDLREHDLLITCTDHKYQKMTIQGLPQAWWTQNETFKKAVVEAYNKKKQEFDLLTKVAKYIAPEEQLAYMQKRQANKPQNTQQGSNVGFNPMAAMGHVPPAATANMPSFSPTPPAQPPPLQGSTKIHQPESAPDTGSQTKGGVDLDAMLEEMN